MCWQWYLGVEAEVSSPIWLIVLLYGYSVSRTDRNLEFINPIWSVAGLYSTWAFLTWINIILRDIQKKSCLNSGTQNGIKHCVESASQPSMILSYPTRTFCVTALKWPPPLHWVQKTFLSGPLRCLFRQSMDTHLDAQYNVGLPYQPVCIAVADQLLQMQRTARVNIRL